MPPTHTDAFFQAALSDKDLEQILQRIDENLELRSVLEKSRSTSVQAAETPALLPDLGEMARHLQELHYNQAPLFVIKGNRWQRFLRRLINYPIRIFGYKQLGFNHELLAALDALMPQLHSLQKLIVQQSKTQETLQQLERSLSQVQQIDQILKADMQQLSSAQTTLSADVQKHTTWLDRIAIEQRGQSDWTTLLQKKIEWLSLSVREMSAAHPDDDLPEPHVVDPERFSHLLASMRGQLRVNVGCGEKLLDGYINVDLRELTGVDILADVRRLPFERATLTEIASAHLIEHFREHQARQSILPYWKSLLKRPDGVLRTICPNWEAMLQRLHDGRMSLAEFKLVTFGAQDYNGDDHFAMYTPATLCELLLECGFSRTEVVVAERMNGICPEMEILALV